MKSLPAAGLVPLLKLVTAGLAVSCLEPAAVQPAAAGLPVATFADRLRSGGSGPELVTVPSGRFRMGCIPAGDYQCVRGRPVIEVAIPAAFALSVHEITFEQYDRYMTRTKRSGASEADDNGWGRGRRPVVNIRYAHAVAFTEWLSRETGQRYRLPSEAEWEYAARAGTETLWPWGNEFQPGRANCANCGSSWDDEQTAPVGSFPPNPWGLHDMHGNVWEMVQDCGHRHYRNHPRDGSPLLVPRRRLLFKRAADDDGRCIERIIRGGGWAIVPRLHTQSAARAMWRMDWLSSTIGFRVVRELGG